MASTVNSINELINRTISLQLNAGQSVLRPATTSQAMSETSSSSSSSHISIDVKESVEFQQRIAELTKAFNDYAAKQKDFVHPVAHISLEETKEGIEIHIDTEFKGTAY